ncbi:MAG: T9SS type A sorting domain-containing protein [Bacteroidota bacterium]
MKKLFILLALALCLTNLKAQFVTIPNANFVSWLQTNVPSAMNGNQMDTTNVAITTYTYINVQNLGITDLTGVQYFDSLKALDCTNNQLSFLPSLPSRLLSLTCSQNQLTSIPSLPYVLGYMDCSNNQLTNLPLLPNTIRYLYCSYNQLSSLPALPSSLLGLWCYNNLLTSLPPIPSGTNYLYCFYNNLTSLPTLPTGLLVLNCSYNQLNSLPTLPSGLSHLICSYNQLNSLPVLPSGLEFLICSYNNITCLPLLPPIQSEYYYSPGVPPVIDFDIKNNPFTCLPNYVPAMDATLLSYPLCSAGNTNGCAVTITGLYEQTETFMNVYPNPSNGSFTIELNNNERQSIQLFDITGNVVLSQSIENEKTIIDAGHLAAGIYNITIKGSNSVSNKKLVIVK